MKLSWFSKLICSAVVWQALSSPATAQFDCRLPTSNEWLRQPKAPFNWQNLQAIAIRQVRADDVGLAIERLANDPVIELSNEQVELIGEPETVRGGEIPSGWRPFLIRAVFPTGNPQISLNWAGEDLVVHASGLGCAAFAKHPIIVYLDRVPAHLYVTASAAL